MIKPTKEAYIISVLVLITVLFLVFAKPFAVTGTTWGVYPIWGRLQCERVDDVKRTSNLITIPKEGGYINCGDKELTAECDIYLSAKKPVWWAGEVRTYYKKCNDLNGINCDPQYTKVWTQEGMDNLIVTITNGQSVKLYTERFLWVNTEADYYKKYYRWGLSTYIEGALYQTPGTCRITDTPSLLSRIPIQHADAEYLKFSGGLGQSYINFITKWVFGPPVNVYNHFIYGEVYCEGGNIYKIRTLKTADQTVYKIRDRSYTDTTGNIYITPSEFIKKEPCCPGMSTGLMTCGNDFQWHMKPGTCTSSIDCANGGQWYSSKSKTACRSTCVNNYCKEECKTVECSMDADCIPPKHCDPRDWTCKMDTPNPFCGDTICNSDESQLTCCKDCGCPEGQGCVNNKCEVGVIKGCGDCFSWLWNILKGKTYCTPKPADKLLWILPIPLTAQDSVCPIFLTVLGSIIALTTTYIIIMIKRK